MKSVGEETKLCQRKALAVIDQIEDSNRVSSKVAILAGAVEQARAEMRKDCADLVQEKKHTLGMQMAHGHLMDADLATARKEYALLQWVEDVLRGKYP